MAYKNIADRKAYAKKHYENNKELYKSRSKLYSRKERDIIRRFLIKEKSNPCKDCGQVYPHYVMEFDHLKDKDGDIANFASLGWSLKRVKNEIEKCDLVCANCHRIRTYKRKSRSTTIEV